MHSLHAISLTQNSFERERVNFKTEFYCQGTDALDSVVLTSGRMLKMVARNVMCIYQRKPPRTGRAPLPYYQVGIALLGSLPKT